MSDVIRCPACDSGSLAGGVALYDDRYGYPNGSVIVRCTGCGHKFADRMLGPDVLKILYTEYYQRDDFDPGNFAPYAPKGGWRGWMDGELSTAAAWVPENVRVLDIGCGLGTRVAYHAKRGCDAHGIDADGNVNVIAQRYGLNIHVGLFDTSDYAAESFDYVTLDQVIEHVSDPTETLNGIARILQSGGFCVMSTPNANGALARLFGRRWLNWHIPYHQHFLSPASMTKLAEKAGFVVERMVTRTPSAWLLFQFVHALMYPRQGDPSRFWMPKLHPPGSRERGSVFVPCWRSV